MYVIKNFYPVILFSICCWLMFGCSPYRAPSGWLPERNNVAKEPYGGWLYVEFKDRGVEKNVRGEYIGIVDTTLLLLNINGIIRIPKDNITYAALKINDDDRGLYVAWTILGILGTPFVNGFYSIFTLPLWIVGGIASSTAEGGSGSFVSYDRNPLWWRSIAPYSRFPQGIPHELDVDLLKPKLITRRHY
jgi:hypothetical protein